MRIAPFLRIAIFFAVCYCLFFQTVSAQKGKDNDPIPVNTEGKYEYSQVVEVPNVSKDELYERCKSFVTKEVASLTHWHNVKQNKDKDAGEYHLTLSTQDLPSNAFGFLSIGCGRVRCSIDIFVKDGKYKYIINNFHHFVLLSNQIGLGDLTPNSKGRGMPLKDIRKGIDVNAQYFIAQLKDYMSKPRGNDF